MGKGCRPTRKWSPLNTTAFAGTEPESVCFYITDEWATTRPHRRDGCAVVSAMATYQQLMTEAGD